MIRRIFLATAIALAAVTASAQNATELVTLDSRQDSQGWEAVGRLNIDNSGFCTAALIRDRLLLTAAHCVYDSNNELISADKLVFQAGLRNGRAAATRNIIRIVAHPDYVPDGPTARVDGVRHDIAVLELSQPIRYSGIQPFPIAARPFAGDEVAIVSYGKNRAEAPSLQESCTILGRQSGALVMDCDVESGSSGSPVFRIQNGRAQIVSVVSAVAESSGNKISLGTSLQEPLQVLLAEFAARGPAKPGGEQRLIQIGERNDTGAKFISSN
ncbi:V8-like Glu-specific endopeptidase [Loktanella ponticola]|uniref:V8-like Glu-specific endopeptidase n=1 Tax=Yoonia ponticola TaxID=1524255 RepID=A0A7W9BLA2_9RHOB|nr:trypsin-like serine protease [Yoonia ponticola]MBB5722613.1 V8-like Glu-specific endopeptidase [Yoonia ponticola]